MRSAPRFVLLCWLAALLSGCNAFVDGIHGLMELLLLVVALFVVAAALFAVILVGALSGLVRDKPSVGWGVVSCMFGALLLPLVMAFHTPLFWIGNALVAGLFFYLGVENVRRAGKKAGEAAAKATAAIAEPPGERAPSLDEVGSGPPANGV